MPVNHNLKDNSSSTVLSKIELGLNKAWQSQTWWLWFLLPLSWLYGLVSYIRRVCYQKSILSRYKAPVPVMIIGNISVGGSGKTPLIIALVKYLQIRQINVAVISRGYGGDESLMPTIVTAKSTPEEVGDEPCLIVRETGAVVSVCPDRQQAIECILNQYPHTQLIIADDGLQHYKLNRDIEWIVVDSARGFGNKQLLPTGFLREPLSRLDNATVIYHQLPEDMAELQRLDETSKNVANTSRNEVKTNSIASKAQTLNESTAKKQSNNDVSRGMTPTSNRLTMSLFADKLVPLLASPSMDNPSSNCKSEVSCNPAVTASVVYAMSGIGFPKRFFDTLRMLNFDVIERPMPDHHQYSLADFADLTDYPVIVTSKDAVKIAPLVTKHPQLQELSIWVLPVRAVLSDNCYAVLMQQLKALGVTTNKS